LLVDAFGVDGVGFVGVRCRGRGCWSRCGSSSCLPVAVVGVDCVFHKSVRCRGRGCWPRCGLSWWPLPLLMACASLVFDVVGVVAGRGVGRGEGRCWPFMVSVERAFPVFDGVVYSLAEDWVVVLACSWSLPLSVGLAFRVFDNVGASAGRELGRCAGRRRCRWCVPQECSTLWVWLLAEVWVVLLVVVGVDGAGHLRVRACSRLWAGVLAVV